MPLSIPKQLSALSQHHIARRLAGSLAAIALLYGVCGFFILPSFMQSQMETLIAEKLHRKTSVGAVEINPFSLTLTLRDVKLREPKSDDVFASFDTLYVNLSSESLLRLAPVIREAKLTNPYVHLARAAAHHYNIDDILELIASRPPSDKPARFSVNNIRVEGGRIEFDDHPAKTVHAITDITLGIPFISSLPSQVGIFVEPLLRAKVNGSPMEFKGKAHPFAVPADAVVELKLNDLDLTRYFEYLPVRPQVSVSGAKLDLDLTAHFRQGGTLLLQGAAALKSLQIANPHGKPVLWLRELGVKLREADVFAGRIDVSQILLDGLQADASRDADGQLDISKLLPASAAPDGSPAKTTAKPAGLRLTLDELAIRGAALRYTDEQSTQPMRASIDKLDLSLRKVALDIGKRSLSVSEAVSGNAEVLFNRNTPPAKKAAEAVPVTTVASAPASSGTTGQSGYAIDIGKVAISNWAIRAEERNDRDTIVTTAAPVSLNLQDLSSAPASHARMDFKASVNKSGRMSVNGTVGFFPLHADLALDIKGVDILPLQPLLAHKINLRVTNANLSSNGRIKLDAAGDGTLQGGFKGDATLGDLATVDKAGGNDFLRWKSLHAAGMDVRFAPFGMSIEQVALADFFARITIAPTGRINLQDIVHSETSQPAPASPSARRQADQTRMPPIVIKRVSLQGGRIRFTDNFIKPNYSASLSQFGGVLSGLSSDPSTRADVDLRGEVNSAPLSVSGKINPLQGDLFLDLKANVRGMELAPLSAYSGKYVGYGIEKGKLSFEVGYRVDKRQLTAENRLVLDQLTFGDKIDSPHATNLPVHFAVALLADRNGVIDINLPIAGSLDDPEFSIGAIVFKLVGNAIAKAVTQPFAMLGKLFGGGAELSSMTFDPGRAVVPATGEEKLRSLAKALAERPGLKLDIIGHADLEADREGLKHAQIERKVRALKIRDLRAKGVEVEPGSVTVNREEYPALLLRAYRNETFPKPRNMLGLPKDLPVEEMEKLLMANADIDEDDLVALGNQRAQAVKNWLQKNGQVPAERMFIVAAKVNEKSKDNGALPSRVDFALR